jgi:hypothetical protein
VILICFASKALTILPWLNTLHLRVLLSNYSLLLHFTRNIYLKAALGIERMPIGAEEGLVGTLESFRGNWTLTCLSPTCIKILGWQDRIAKTQNLKRWGGVAVMRGYEHWTLNAEHWTLNLERWTLNDKVGRRTLNAKSRQLPKKVSLRDTALNSKQDLKHST